ncbi:hypothetical protein ACF0H5_013241 [Mactra antiquata]
MFCRNDALVQDTWSYRLPEYIDRPSNVTYYRGDSATLYCAVKYLGTKQVIWKKRNELHPLTYGKMTYINDDDYTVDHNPHSDEWNLVIKNVQLKHAGEYECQISTTEDLRKYVQLNVIDEPAPPREAIKITGESFVEKGDKIRLTCNATGELFPPEDIDWFKDGLKIKANGTLGISILKFRIAETKTLHSRLEIDKADMRDIGVYICRSSELAVTRMDVMVLNEAKSGHQKIRPRSQDKTLMTQESTYIAETNHNKRENPNQSDASASTSAACSEIRVGNMYTTLLSMLCFFYVAVHIRNRTL